MRLLCKQIWHAHTASSCRHSSCVLQEGTKNILRSSGVDVDSISAQADTASKTIQDASVKATPLITKVSSFLTTSTPETLGKIAVVLVLAYYLTPFALKATVSSLRGYAGLPSSVHAQPNPTVLVGWTERTLLLL